jgi:tellurite resistance protein TerC
LRGEKKRVIVGEMIKNSKDKSARWARQVVIAVIGMTVLLGGIAMLVLPGPAFIVIPTGLAILATEFVWARRLLKKAKKTVQDIKKGMAKNNNRNKSS